MGQRPHKEDWTAQHNKSTDSRPASERTGRTGKSEMRCHGVTVIHGKQDEKAEGQAAQPVTYFAWQSKRLNVSLFCVKVTRTLKNVVLFLSPFSSISPLVAYFTHTAAKLSLEESGKHQRGMRGISAFRFSSTRPPPPPSTVALLTLDAFA